MKLDFSRKGLQFFFVTVAVAGRRELLATLGGEGERPVLTRLGEVVWAGLNALHLVNAAWAAAKGAGVVGEAGVSGAQLSSVF